LDHGRLHHAYLFTGTRGVGKTTIARILAKSLNCETGVSSEPCGTCGACTEINEGRFIDLIEVDAASKTKVEDTRELLENVQYAPTRGRYKVYLIDEVHMLSGHSFNALLKTLEEPPPHVKFLLATTDPQKLPITILSRCLQFSLKAMTPEKIVGHLQNVLAEEMVAFEEPALWAIGRAADGSMRDALSLTDQAIAFGNGKVVEGDVQAMLGTIDRAYTYQLLDAVVAGDGPNLLSVVSSLAEQSPDYIGVLADLIDGLHRVAVAQIAPDAVDNTNGDKEKVMTVASQLAAEDVQLFYQTALLGRKDLPLAPDPRSGFEMILLRMLMFRPEGILPPPATQGGAGRRAPAGNPPAPRGSGGSNQGGAQYGASHNVSANNTVAVNAPASGATQAYGNGSAGSATNVMSAVRSSPMQQAREALEHGATKPRLTEVPQQPSVANVAQPAQITPPSVSPSTAQSASSNTSNVVSINAPANGLPTNDAPAKVGVMQQPYGDSWADLLSSLELNGSVLNFARNCSLESEEGNEWTLALGPRHESLFKSHHIEALEKAIAAIRSEKISLSIDIRVPTKDTPDTLAAKRRAKRFENAEASLRNDPFVSFLFEKFNGVLDKDSIKPLD